MIVTGAILLLLFLLSLDMPIVFTLIVVGSLGIYTVGGIDAFSCILSTTAYRSVNSFTLTTIPLFILMAHFISKSNIARDLYSATLKWIGHIPGGVGISTVFASAGFGALSGSSVAATSIMSKICVPEMVKAKYKDTFSAGLVASTTGTLAVMIPPSIPLILYAIQTETSVGKLLIAGILPGIMLAVLLCIYIVIYSVKMDNKIEKSSWSARFSSLKTIWPMILLIIIIMSIIYLGIATSTEAAAFGAFGALIIGILLGKLNIGDIKESFHDAIQQTAMIFVIVIGGYIFSYFITMTGVGQNIIIYISESGFSKWTVLTFIILFFLVIGLFLDLIASLILTLPLVHPLMVNMGFDE